mmetsp:Transcript_21058/g.32137  ORF Transcript_21058/g.32137 Transcript_21058/m.32137 type:complete len:240 (-) Transcript_21058:36-755(-)
MADFDNLLKGYGSDKGSNETSSNAGSNFYDQAEDAEYEQLKRWWTQELASPDLMPYDEECIDMHLDLLQGQEDIIDRLMEGERGAASHSITALEVSVYRMEIDRLRFLLADLARCRLAKIEKYALHIRGSPEQLDRLSDKEIDYLREYGKLVQRHFERTVLSHLPKAFRAIDTPEMIDSPDLDEYVFCRILETVEIETDDRDDDDEYERAGVHKSGSSLIVRYRTVKNLIEQGKVVLMY